jgi:hypothetical protein
MACFTDSKGEIVAAQPMASGKRLVVAPENDLLRMSIESGKGDLQLLDGRYVHNNGWFVVRSLVAGGSSQNAIEWIITPNDRDGKAPRDSCFQIGYHPDQKKVALVEIDKNEQK